MAKLLPFRRRTVRAAASCCVVLAVLLQAFAFLLAGVAHAAPRGDEAFVTASAEICGAASAGGDHAPPGGRHPCGLCPLGGCGTGQAGAGGPPAAAVLPPRPLAAASGRLPDVDAPPPAARTSSSSPRAPPRA
ncbi:DUF2946 family protein [Methylosinus sp. Sm6]|uniref:DUF2946 family protein n=1 Tax=Methylosinus sp. Sm6 TaxID=2866948 RepID=UPI001C99D2E3|nr:DUF2946 family protein [Methylosinus sp. Sm6]MBY6243813.1 hypothetical protein [Methylosinus sp. Sm6]